MSYPNPPTPPQTDADLFWSPAEFRAACVDPQGWSDAIDPTMGLPIFLHHSGVGVRYVSGQDKTFVLGNRLQSYSLTGSNWSPCPPKAPDHITLQDFQNMLEWSFCSEEVPIILAKMAVYLVYTFAHASGAWSISAQGRIWPQEEETLLQLMVTCAPDVLRSPHAYLLSLMHQLRIDTQYVALSSKDQISSRPFFGNVYPVGVHIPDTAHGKAALFAQAAMQVV